MAKENLTKRLQNEKEVLKFLFKIIKHIEI